MPIGMERSISNKQVNTMQYSMSAAYSCMFKCVWGLHNKSSGHLPHGQCHRLCCRKFDFTSLHHIIHVDVTKEDANENENDRWMAGWMVEWMMWRYTANTANISTYFDCIVCVTIFVHTEKWSLICSSQMRQFQQNWCIVLLLPFLVENSWANPIQNPYTHIVAIIQRCSHFIGSAVFASFVVSINAASLFVRVFEYVGVEEWA